MLNYFNRLINIKRFVRTLKNGKKVIVKPHSRRAAMMRIKEGLESIKDLDIENAYIVSNSGKLSKAAKGDLNSVDLSVLYPKSKKGYLKRIILHNHPGLFSPLSFVDILNTRYTQRNIFAIDKSGNVFRSKFNPDFNSKKNNITNAIKKVYKDTKKELEIQGYTWDFQEHAVFSHYLYNLLNNDKVIRYKAYLTEDTIKNMDTEKNRMILYILENLYQAEIKKTL